MEIQIKRNKQENSQFPSSLLPGEPMWFKDKLYVGSVGTTLGGQSTTGTPIAIGVQSDWEQNDTTASDYVKNRTHWEEDPVVTNHDMMNNSDVSVSSLTRNGVRAICIADAGNPTDWDDSTLNFILGYQQLVVSVNGHEFTVQANNDSSETTGSFGIYDIYGIYQEGTEDSGYVLEDNMCYVHRTMATDGNNDYQFIYIYVPDSVIGSGLNSVIIKTTQSSVHQIPEKFIPYKQADWEQEDTTAPDYIKHKPKIPDNIDRINEYGYIKSSDLYLSDNVVDSMSWDTSGYTSRYFFLHIPDSTTLNATYHSIYYLSGIYSENDFENSSPITFSPGIYRCRLNDGSLEYTSIGGGGSSALSDLTDTAITTPSNGHVLTYDSTTSKWVNAAVAEPNNSTITIQKNGTAVDTFTLNQSTDKSINITVPTSASDVGALPSSTKYGSSITTSIDSSTYVLTTTLKDQDGNTLGTVQTVDLPLETMVVSGSYDSTNKKVVLTLKNGSTVDFSVADLVSGLQSEITSSNKLSADLISDGTTNKAYTATEKTKLSGIETGAQVNVKPDWNAASGAAAEILNKPTIPTVNNATLTIKRNGTSLGTFAANSSTNTEVDISVPSAPGTLNTTATTAQSTNSSEALSGNITLHKVAKTGTYSDLIGTPTIPTVNNATLTIQKNGTTVNTFAANASSDVTANISVRELPEVTSSDNNKVLMVVNGAWAAQTVDIQAYYTGSSEPSNSIGNNGDLYLQTN